MSKQHVLWAPWRIDYLREQVSGPSEGVCFLCRGCDGALSADELAEAMVITRWRGIVVMMNRFPYTNGHLLVAPGDHVGTLSELSAERRGDLMEAIGWAESLVRIAVAAQGVNVGFNLGRCAGAAVPGHLHAHVVPRWHGDVNFMETVGRARVMPQALEAAYADMLRAQEKAGPIGPA
ncbi:HIT family protein [Mucisphaera sp.]|uniref:HIT family protein n=1 Tax=Mucisphaera sp. TaxID=2913024 RepID=UPI003D0AA3CD